MSVEVLVAVVASVCGLLLTRTLTESMPELTLAGTALGAAIPPFVSTAGRRRGLRATMAVLVTVGAVGVTYAGTIAVSTVTHEETLPGSTALAEVFRPPTTTPTRPTIVEETTGRMEVTPDALNCTPGCEGPVTIRNTGGTRFVIESIDVDGAGAASFSHDEGCVGVELGEGEKCGFSVAFDPDGTDDEATATLLVRNDLTENNEATVTLAGHGQSAIDLAIAADNVRCTYEAAEGADGSLSVAFVVTVTGTDESGDVPVTVSSNSGSSDTTTVFVGDGADETVVTLPVDGEDSGDHLIKVNVDPDNEIPEAAESNNDAEAYCAA